MKTATLEREVRRLKKRLRETEAVRQEQVAFKIGLAKELEATRFEAWLHKSHFGEAASDLDRLMTENRRLHELLQQYRDRETDKAWRKIRAEERKVGGR